MRALFTSLIVLTLLIALPALANENAFEKISDHADMANGSSSVDRYSLRTPKPKLVADSLAEMKKDHWDNCSPWKLFKERRPAIKYIAYIDENTDAEFPVAPQLQALY